MRRTSIFTTGLIAVFAAFHTFAVLSEEGGVKAPATQQADGTIQLTAHQATLHGEELKILPLDATGVVCAWINADNWVSWQMQLQQPGEYVVELNYSCTDGSQGSTFEIAFGEDKLAGKIAESTGSWYDYRLLKVGTIKLSKPGLTTVSLKTISKPGYAVMNLSRLRLAPPEKYESLRSHEAADEAKLSPSKPS